MMDIMIMVITIAGMYISSSSPKVDFLPDNAYRFILMAIPLWGLYANMIAQLISQVSSHFIIHYHRHVVRIAKKRIEQKLNIEHLNYDVHTDENAIAMDVNIAAEFKSNKNSAERKSRLCDHYFAIPHGEPEDTCVVKPWLRWLVLFLATAMIILQIASAILPTMSFKFHGLFGLFMDWGGTSYIELNLFGFADAHIKEAEYMNTVKDWVGLVSVCVVFILTVLVVPILQMIALMVLWLVPMTDKNKKRMLLVIEILVAWEYAEVFLFAVLLEAWIFEDISSYLFNWMCRPYWHFLDLANYYGVLSDQNTTCYLTSLMIEPALYTLVLSTFLLYLVNAVVTKAAIQYFREQQGCDLVPPQDIADDMLEVSSDAPDENEEDGERVMKPFPVLFTDAFALGLHHTKKKVDNFRKVEKKDTGTFGGDSNDEESL